MVVEFFGIPGSGKTFQANLFKKKLRHNRIKYIDFSRHSGMPLWMKIFYKMTDYAILVLPKYRKQIAEYKEVCKDCPKAPAFISFSLDYCIKDIVLYSFVNDMFRQSETIIVNDEGQLHRVIFLIVQFNCPFDQVFDLYLSHKHNETIRYVQTSSEQAFQNIKNRNRKVCPMDEMDDNLLKEYINTFARVCEEVICRDLKEIKVI